MVDEHCLVLSHFSVRALRLYAGKQKGAWIPSSTELNCFKGSAGDTCGGRGEAHNYYGSSRALRYYADLSVRSKYVKGSK